MLSAAMLSAAMLSAAMLSAAKSKNRPVFLRRGTNVVNFGQNCMMRSKFPQILWRQSELEKLRSLLRKIIVFRV